ncbi:DUF5685 family protein [Streptomonospora wellingtoniae]|uniref:DUF5685 family protein n=1 Tax=Streptomonospora wellingtoniae TaxID=3075544 RepID=A0ABU2KT22_9ACTN|nr:DUF5685 family protein [Streptomonospora sp. DSM 45055]MDT0302351.1 DUF5685 family protein [Streptomonospora sp. DSM 45055]
MFGILRPCRHTLPGDLAASWMSHLCGLCLALRDGHGQLARTATNYDGLVVSALTAAQRPAAATRAAGPCPLRGMRGADVAAGAGAELAASVSLLLAAARIGDHIADGDGLYARGPVRAAAGALAARWERAARNGSGELGFDAGVLLEALDGQRWAESAAENGADVLAATRPTEFATGEAFAHTAVLAGRPGNRDPLREAGRLFGRIAHLLDAVEDAEDDRAAGAWNPVEATGTAVAEVRRLCDDAALGVELALAEADLDDGRLVRALLVHELRRSVARTFTAAGYPESPGHPRSGGGRGRHGYPGGHGDPEDYGGRRGGRRRPQDDGYAGAFGPVEPPPGAGGPHNGHRPAGDQGGCCCTCNCETPKIYAPPKKRGLFAGCAVALFMCCTCQPCCRDPHPGPWSGEHRGPCLDCCSGCNTGGGGSGGDGGGDGGGGGGCDCDCSCD